MDHAPFIWSSYAITALILAWTAVSPLVRKRRALRNIQRLKNQEMNDDTHA